jgi:hypothetical protein
MPMYTEPIIYEGYGWEFEAVKMWQEVAKTEEDRVVAIWQAHLVYLMPSDFGTPEDGLGVLV